MATTRFAQNDLARLSYAVSGEPDAPPVVLLHGLLNDRSTMRPLADALSDSFRIIVPDARGHGASSALTDRSITLTDLANDVVAILDAEGITGQVRVVAHGIGATTALELVHWRPDRFAALVLIEPDAVSLLDPQESDAMATARESSLGSAAEAADAAYKQLADKALSTYLAPRWGEEWRVRLPKIRLAAVNRHVHALAPMLDAVSRLRLVPEDLSALTAPTMIVDAGSTPEADRLASDLVATWLPDAERRTIRHMPGGQPFADNAEAVEAITAFLATSATGP